MDEQNKNSGVDSTESNTNTEPAGGEPNASAPENMQNPPAEKTFTQKELDDIVKQRLDRASKNMPSKEDLEAFKTWQDSQKTAEEKHNEAVNAANLAKDNAEQRAYDFEAKYTAMAKGVKNEAVDDVIALAKGKVNDDTTLEQAIDAVIKKYPSFAAIAQLPGTTGVHTPNNSTANTTDEAAVRKVMGLPDKK